MGIFLDILLAIGSPAFEGLITILGGPRLEVHEPFIDSRSFLMPNQEAFSLGGTVTFDEMNSLKKQNKLDSDSYSNRYYIHVPIYNKQKSRIESSTAKKLYAKLKFFDLNGNPIGTGREFDGRWERSQQPTSFESIEQLRFIDILPEDHQTLDISTQEIKGGNWYVMNNDSYKGFNPDFVLGDEGFIFRVELNGANVFKKCFSYRFLNRNREFTKQDC